MQWIEGAVQELVGLRTDAAKLRACLTKAPSEAEAAYQRMRTRDHALDLILAQRYLYAPAAGIAAVDALLDLMNTFGGTRQSIDPGAIQELVDQISRTILVLSNEMRAELRWDAMPTDGSVTVTHLGTDPQ